LHPAFILNRRSIVPISLIFSDKTTSGTPARRSTCARCSSGKQGIWGSGSDDVEVVA
jgi:hypothetical protein